MYVLVFIGYGRNQPHTIGVNVDGKIELIHTTRDAMIAITPAVKRLDSSDSNVSKYVFSFNNAVAEAVLYKYNTFTDRTVICCSTQSGCPVGCRFCGAGDYFVRNLTSDEIVFQVQHLFNDRNIDPASVERGQIMFMSMGEPMLNFRQLEKAICQLHELYPTFALLISTSGPDVNYTPLIDLSRTVPAVGLQFSVHESTDERRNALIPFEAKLNLSEISKVGNQWHDAVGRQPFFNYCAQSHNTTDDDADRLLALFDPMVWQSTVSVVCERSETVAASNDRQREIASEFMNKLLQRGFSVRCFDPAGQEAGGGCGQLWYVQKWMKDNPHLARPTCGHSLPKVHPSS